MESPFTCRYGHGKLIVFPDVIALPVPPPWQVTSLEHEVDGVPSTVTANPAHLRVRIHYCEQCTYTELHYVRN